MVSHILDVTLDPTAATVFFLLTLPVCIWVMLSDLRHMKIRNHAILALMAIFLVTGPMVLPLETFMWHWLGFAIVMILGFVTNMLGVMGAGDAKFFAAAALYIAFEDISAALYILAMSTIIALVSHRLVRSIPSVTRTLPGWESWTHEKFPMGIALGPWLSTYLALAAFG